LQRIERLQTAQIVWNHQTISSLGKERNISKPMERNIKRSFVFKIEVWVKGRIDIVFSEEMKRICSIVAWLD
jgi:hypothetical protein